MEMPGSLAGGMCGFDMPEGNEKEQKAAGQDPGTCTSHKSSLYSTYRVSSATNDSCNAATDTPGDSASDAGASDSDGDGGESSEDEGSAELRLACDIRRLANEAASSIRPWPYGEGSFGSRVRLQDAQRNHGHVDRMCTPSGEPAAVKTMPQDWVCLSDQHFVRAHPKSSERPWLDIAILKYLNSLSFPYVVEFWGIYTSAKDTMVVTSLASEGDLFAWCSRLDGFGVKREDTIRDIVRQTLTATVWLHDLGVVHGDLSLENIVLSAEGAGLAVKLIDFGMATLERFGARTGRRGGKWSYQAPEMQEPLSVYDGFLTDTFALGMVVFVLATTDHIATQPGDSKLWDFVKLRGFRTFLERRKLRGTDTRLINVLSEDIIALLVGLLEVSPAKRVTLGELQWQKSFPTRPSVWDMAWLTSPRAR